MGQNDENTQSCKSVRCCCQLISKCEEKPAAAPVATKPRNACGGRAERPQMSLCDFLKSQPIPEWIKINDVRPQQHQNQQRSTQPCAPNKPKGSSMPEDVQSSQIIINFGTVVTNGACKRDSCQQTDPEVQQRACLTTVSPPPVNRSTSACPPAKRSTSNCPPADRPASSCPAPATEPPARDRCSQEKKTCQPARPIPTCPPANRSTTSCPPANRPTTTCPPANRPTTTCPPTDLPAYFCPPSTEPSARDRCSQEKAKCAAFPSSPPKARPECGVKKIKCACTCHSDA